MTLEQLLADQCYETHYNDTVAENRVLSPLLKRT